MLLVEIIITQSSKTCSLHTYTAMTEICSHSMFTNNIPLYGENKVYFLVSALLFTLRINENHPSRIPYFDKP